MKTWVQFVIGIVIGAVIGYFVFNNCPEESPKSYDSETQKELEAWKLKAYNLDIEKEQALAKATKHQTAADSLQEVLITVRSTPLPNNYLDSTDSQILAGFNKNFGGGKTKKLPVPRDQLAKALNSLDLLKRCETEVSTLESIITEHEANQEGLLEAIDKLEEKGTVLDTALSACIESNKSLKADNDGLATKAAKENSSKKRWRLVTFVSVGLNIIQAWLR